MDKADIAWLEALDEQGLKAMNMKELARTYWRLLDIRDNKPIL